MKNEFRNRFFKLLANYDDITVGYVADCCKIPRSTLYSYVNGASELTIGNACKIADFFGVSIDYLVGRAEI